MLTNIRITGLSCVVKQIPGISGKTVAASNYYITDYNNTQHTVIEPRENVPLVCLQIDSLYPLLRTTDIGFAGIQFVVQYTHPYLPFGSSVHDPKDWIWQKGRWRQGPPLGFNQEAFPVIFGWHTGHSSGRSHSLARAQSRPYPARMASAIPTT
jgi:hypothetical protein